MVTSEMFPRNWAAWEVDPSTRSAVHPWTKYVPIDKTLTTAGTAEDLFTVSPGVPTVNIATNPSFESGTPPTGYVAVGSSLTKSTTIARTGPSSMLVDPNNIAPGEGFYWPTPGLAGPHDQPLFICASIYINDNAGAGTGVRIEIRDDNGVLLRAGNTVSLAASWNRSQVTYALTPISTTYRIYVVNTSQNNNNFFVDSFQVEIRQDSTVTDYVDGSLGLNAEWFDAAHASPSRRRKGIAIIRGFDLYVDADVYIAFDHVASSATGVPILANGKFSSEWPLDYRKRISFVNINANQRPRVRGVVWGIPGP